MRVRIDVEENEAPLQGELRYVAQDYSFNFEVDSTELLRERIGLSGVGSLVLGTLQIEVAVDSGYLLYPEGYCPHTAWHAGSVNPLPARDACLRVSDAGTIQRGAGIRVGRRETPLIVYDRKSGWLRLQLDGADAVEDAVMFATGAIAGLSKGELLTLWLKPSS